MKFIKWTEEISRELIALDLAKAALGSDATAYDLHARARTIARDIRNGKIVLAEGRAA